MRDMYISDSILYVGADDKTLDIFESQYPIPNGVSYNSYVILDEKVAVMDTVDKRATDTWFENLARELGDRKPDYLVVSHMEPDHAANIKNFAERYPETKIVGNAKKIRQSIRIQEETCDGNGRPCWNAASVICTPSRSGFCHAPEMTIDRPVMVQMIMVSINVPVMVTRP